jgi:hypothetical protein
LVLFFIVFFIVRRTSICISEHIHGTHHSCGLDLALGVSGIFAVLVLSILFDLELFLDHFLDFEEFFFLRVKIFSLADFMRFESFLMHSLIQRVEPSMLEVFH